MQVWSEGYQATGNESGAILHGEVSGATTLKNACAALAEQNPEFRAHYDAKRMTWWGCRLFADESEARQSYG